VAKAGIREELGCFLNGDIVSLFDLLQCLFQYLGKKIHVIGGELKDKMPFFLHRITLLLLRLPI